ncbi:MAG TPA: hypothetical protein VMM56_07295 [Planctomycetaceae bacterium]|nr:hypothetical protein [Planctomycetaceae bacterium]
MMKSLPIIATAAFLSTASVVAAAEVQTIATPRFDDVKAQALEWVAQQKIDDRTVLEPIGQLWAAPELKLPAAVVFDRVIETFRLADADSARFIESCRLTDNALTPPSAEVLESPRQNEFYRSNLAQFYGVYLVRRQMYDEALLAFAKVDLAQSVDPPAHLFHLAVAQSELLMKEDGLATLTRLRKETEQVPARYSMVAELMEFELNSLEEESMGEVAHRMKNVGRLLGLARGGQKTQKEEEEIVVLLDSIIEKMEQNNGGGSGQGSGGNTNNPGGGAQDSVIKGTTAPGNVDEKKLDKQAGWGALPDANVAKAKNLLKRDFPENYRRAIEAYFRKSAGRGVSE